jgi:hypothetical protein
MRIQHVAQAVKGWPDNSNGDRSEGARFADAVEHVRWRLWHGQVQRALDLIGDTVTALAAVASSSRATASKVGNLLRSLETYVAGQAELIIDYAAARHDAEPISTAPTESTVQWLLHRRMGGNQQMRWSPRGAHMMLKVRSAVANGTLEQISRQLSAGHGGRFDELPDPHLSDGILTLATPRGAFPQSNAVSSRSRILSARPIGSGSSPA